MTDWQQQYISAQTPWDRGEPAPALVQYLALHPVSGRILVPGCGTGQDVRALALSGAAEVVGLDIAPLAVAQARELLAEVPGAKAQLGDLFSDCYLAPLAGSFDLVWEHTCYCAIPPARRGEYVDALASALKSGGFHLGVFYLNPWDANEDQTQGPPFGTGLEELKAVLGARFDFIRGWYPDVAYPGREGKEWCGLFQKNP